MVGLSQHLWGRERRDRLRGSQDPLGHWPLRSSCRTGGWGAWLYRKPEPPPGHQGSCGGGSGASRPVTAPPGSPRASMTVGPKYPTALGSASPPTAPTGTCLCRGAERAPHQAPSCYQWECQSSTRQMQSQPGMATTALARGPPAAPDKGQVPLPKGQGLDHSSSRPDSGNGPDGLGHLCNAHWEAPAALAGVTSDDWKESQFLLWGDPVRLR